MTTFALATIIACVTIVVLTVLVLWLGQAKKAKPDMYAMAAETIVNPRADFTGRLKDDPMLPRSLRLVGKTPELGYGYTTKGRRDEADTLGAVTHPNVSLGFGMDEFDLRAQDQIERDTGRQD